LVSVCLTHVTCDVMECDAVCQVSLCPELTYCEGEPVKDHCNCCTVCSESKFQPHVVLVQPPKDGNRNACDQVKCPKFKVCVENMQGVPLCTCPGEYFCRKQKKRNKTVCGNDGKTYPSRCHMGIASCNQGLAVRKMKRGACTEADEKKGAARYMRRMRKLKKRIRRKLKGGKTVKTEAEPKGGKKKRRQKRRQKRRKINKRKPGGKRRSRRHRGLEFGGKASYRSRPVNYRSRNFERTFSHYTWNH